MRRPSRDSIIGYSVCLLAGAGGWLALGAGRQGGEGWDNPLYFSVFMPAAFLLAAILGFFFPERSWRWGLALFGAQVLAALVRNPTGNLLPLGLIMFGILSAPCVLCGVGGAWLRSFADRRRKSSGR